MTKKRKQYTAAEKMTILRQHLLEDVPVSELCDQHDLQPTVFYRWQKRLFEQGAVVFETRREPAQRRLQRQVAQLTEKVQKKNEVLSELMEEYVELKKRWGPLDRAMGAPHHPRRSGRPDQPLGRPH